MAAWVGLGALALGCGGSDKGAAPQAPESGDEPADPALQAVDALAAAEARRLELPGMAVGIVRGGELVHVDGYGSSERAAAIDADTVFRIGSVTKVITAAAALRLRDDGALSLEDPVARHLPELREVLSAEGAEPVRVRHLLQHSSGIPTLGDGSLDWTKGPPISEAQLIASVAKTTLSFEPGSAMAYSNVGMAVAGLVVARASGRPYRDYVDRTLLEPLGMSATRWERGAYPEEQLFPGYVRGEGGFELPDSYWVLGAIEPAGGLYSTVGDMARFVAFQLDPAAAPGVLAADSVAESHRRAMPGSPMGLGWVVSADAELGSIVWHSGATYSYGSWVGFDPQRENGVIVFVSTGDPAVLDRSHRLGMDALRILAGLEPTHTAEAEKGPPGEPTDPALVAEIGRRVLALVNAPESADYAGIFSARFLEQQPAAAMRNFFVGVQAYTGECTRAELAKDAGGGELELKLTCAKANALVTVAAQTAPPHLMDGIMLVPAP